VNTDRPNLLDLLDLHRGPAAADGAMGSALIARGLPPGMPPEAWLLTEEGAAAVGAVHAAHVAAGARVVLTATFGASPVRLAEVPAAGGTAAVCAAAVAIARQAVPTGVAVAGDIGPTGALLAPYGELEPAAARDAFATQAAALAAAGADLLWVETMADLAEARAAVEGARDAAPGLPIVATLTFERGRTLFGDRPEDAAAALAALGVAAVGANCGNGFEAVLEVLPGLRAGAPGVVLVAKANAGRPVPGADGSVAYPATSDDAADYARRAVDLGASIVGGCCGTTAAHVAAIARALRT
jgi:5-methyltetrahydrofolate--homocysteine methyltransferase